MSETEHKELRSLLDAAPVQTLDTKEIMARIPHRYPMLLVDRVDIIEMGRYLVGIKAVTANEQFFAGHFPGNPVMPGVLMLEAMAQTAAAMTMGMEPFKNKLGFFMGLDKVKFRQQVTPGTLLKMPIEILRLGRAGKGRGEVYADGKLAAQAEMSFILVDRS
ncbi:MAG: 3-hydroxyacyl-ACP dehydratase FabZ [Elusimicrobiales bacterium]